MATMTFTKDAILLTLSLLAMLIPMAALSTIIIPKLAGIAVAAFAIKSIGAMLVALLAVEVASWTCEE